MPCSLQRDLQREQNAQQNRYELTTAFMQAMHAPIEMLLLLAQGPCRPLPPPQVSRLAADIQYSNTSSERELPLAAAMPLSSARSRQVSLQAG